MEDVFLPIVICGMLFVGMPWIILHYVTQWKKNSPTLTGEDENLLDDLHGTARRLEERLQTIERIIAADHPEFRISQGTQVPHELPDYDYVRRN